MQKVTRLFPSFSSCQSRTLTDIAETTSINHRENGHSRSSSSLKNSSRLPKICNETLLFHHSSHSQPTNRHHETPTSNLNPTKIHEKSAATSLNRSSASNGGWFTSNDDVKTDNFFSLSSNSGDSFRLETLLTKCSRPKTSAVETNGRGIKQSRTGVLVHELGSYHIATQLYYQSRGSNSRRGSRNHRRIRKGSCGYGEVTGESYAVEKRTSDHRGDFRASMVEMILEKRIFAAEDLGRLLRCFLSVNPVSYHRMIFDVFCEICQTLFTN